TSERAPSSPPVATGGRYALSLPTFPRLSRSNKLPPAANLPAGGRILRLTPGTRHMAKLRIGRDLLKSALDRAILTDAERATVDRLLAAASTKGPVTAEVAQLPQSCLKA